MSMLKSVASATIAIAICSPTYDDDNFSKADRGLINTHGKSGYLVTPKGGLKRLDPFKKDPIIVNNNIRE